jgi:hypothetical protein
MFALLCSLSRRSSSRRRKSPVCTAYGTQSCRYGAGCLAGKLVTYYAQSSSKEDLANGVYVMLPMAHFCRGSRRRTYGAVGCWSAQLPVSRCAIKARLAAAAACSILFSQQCLQSQHRQRIAPIRCCWQQWLEALAVTRGVQVSAKRCAMHAQTLALPACCFTALPLQSSSRLTRVLPACCLIRVVTCGSSHHS